MMDFNDARLHPTPVHMPSLAFGRASVEWHESMVPRAERIIRAYHAAEISRTNSLKAITEADLWTQIVRENFGGLLRAVETGDAVALSRILSVFGEEYVWFGGVTTGVDGFNHLDTDDDSVAYTYFDSLVALAEGLGVCPAENPEQGEGGNWGRNMLRSVDELVSEIQEVIGFDFVPPTGVIPVAGLRSGEKLLHYRHINALYAATRLRDLSGGGRICEFGGGLGLVAYYLWKMGCRDVTLYDIPTTNILSAWFLIGALGDEAVTLEGEPMAGGHAIRIEANWNCVTAPDRHFEITLNQDSFPEISRPILDEYLKQIHRTSGYFLSINHEVEHPISGGKQHLNVAKTLAGDPRMQRLYRAPYWLRRGYVEELYRVCRERRRWGIRRR